MGLENSVRAFTVTTLLSRRPGASCHKRAEAYASHGGNGLHETTSELVSYNR